MPDNTPLAPGPLPPQPGTPSIDSHPRGPLINSEQAARLIMKGTERIRQLAKAGWIAQEGHSNDRRYRLLDVVQGYIRFRDDEDRRANRSAATSRIQDARSREVELKNAQREGRLIELDEAIEAVEEIMGLMRQQLAGLPARVTRDLQLRRTIETAVNDNLDRLADIADEKAKAMATRRTNSQTVAADRARSVGASEPDASANVGSAGAEGPAFDAVHHRTGTDDSGGEI
jgi:phage terminase Nu1 subunit (DNA packaging protein)